MKQVYFVKWKQYRTAQMGIIQSKQVCWQLDVNMDFSKLFYDIKYIKVETGGSREYLPC